MTLSSYFIGISGTIAVYYLIVLEEKTIIYWIVGLYFGVFGLCVRYDIDTFIGLRFIQAVGSCAATVAAIAMVQICFRKEIQSTLFADVSCRAFNVSTYYWRLCNSGLWMARCFLNFNGYWYCGSMASHFGLPHTHEPDTSISLKPKPIILNFGA
jgi:DHA1 family bicyclomycin/chloramphenicol resistance-like MFS transporter